MDKQAFRKSVGKRLRESRKAKGYTAREVGNFLGNAESTVVCWEDGTRTPDLYSLTRLSDLLHVSVDYLLGRSIDYKALARKEAQDEMRKDLKEMERRIETLSN